MDKPSLEALKFLSQSAKRLQDIPGGYIQGDFYADLLKALAIEGDPWRAQDLLKLQDRVRIRVDEKESVKTAVEIVTRICTELNRAGISTKIG
jgi:hypothetical protein